MSVLFIGPTRLGDAILVGGVLAWLHDAYPNQPITVACGPSAAMAFEGAPSVAAVHVMHKRSRGGHWFDLWRAARRQRWRHIVDLRRSIVAWLLCADRRSRVPRGRAVEHRVALASRTLGLAPQPPCVWLSDGHREAASALLPDGGPVLAVGPGANWICKMWPVARFLELSRRLIGAGGLLAGGRLLLVGSAAEREVARPLLQAFPSSQVADGFGLDIPTTAAALSRCTLFVGNDSAMMHLAAAAGVRTVGMFGPTRDEHYRPWGPNGHVVRTPESVEELLATRRPGEPDRSLMESLMPDAVLASVIARWPDLDHGSTARANSEVTVDQPPYDR